MKNGLFQFKMLEKRSFKKAKLKDFEKKIKLDAVNSFDDLDTKSF